MRDVGGECSVDTVRRRLDGEAGALGRWRSVDLRRDSLSRARDAVGFFAFTPAEHEAADRRLGATGSCEPRAARHDRVADEVGSVLFAVAGRRMVANSGDEVDSSFSEPVGKAAAYASSCIQSARRSPIMMQVRLMFARGWSA